MNAIDFQTKPCRKPSLVSSITDPKEKGNEPLLLISPPEVFQPYHPEEEEEKKDDSEKK